MSISDLKIISTGKLKKDYILPTRILWHTEGVFNEKTLLTCTEDQPRIGEGPTAMMSTKEGRRAAILLDFGSEFSGGARVVTRMETGDDGPYHPGVMVHFRFGESVSEAMTPIGEKNSFNAHAPKDLSMVIPIYGCTELVQTGYRFLYMELETKEVDMELVSVHGVFEYRDIPYIGKFECNNSVLTDIYNTSAYTVHLNMQNMLWDGVKRDRLVWIGDMHPETLVIQSVFGYNPIVDEALRYVADTNPIPEWPNHMTTYGMWYILILRDWYFHNGKKELLCELKNYWVPLLKQLLSLVHDKGKALIEEEFERGFFFDWPTREMSEAGGAGVHALLAKALAAGAEICEIVGEANVAIECRKKISQLAYSGLHHGNMKQIVAMMSLAGHISDKEAAKVLTKDGGKGMSTFQSYYILKAAAKTAGTAQALAMLEEYYGGMLKAGATTFWEDFDLEWFRDNARIDTLLLPGEYDIHGDNGRFCYQGLRHSLCHGWSAGPAAFLAEDVLGIQIRSAGCKTLEIKPNLGSLNWAKGSYPTPYGIVTVEAERIGNTVRTKIDSPKEILVIE